MRIIEPYEISKDFEDCTISLEMSYDDKGILLDIAAQLNKELIDRISKITLSDDIQNCMYSRESKYRKYISALRSTRDRIEDNMLHKDKPLEISYFELSLLCDGMAWLYSELTKKIDISGYGILDTQRVLFVNFYLDNYRELTELSKEVELDLFPKQQHILDSLEEAVWDITTDEMIPNASYLRTEKKTVSILVHDYEFDYITEYLMSIRESIALRPLGNKSLKMIIKGRPINIEKEVMVDFIDRLVFDIERNGTLDTVIKLGSNEFILFAILTFHMYDILESKLSAVFSDFNESEYKFVTSAVKQCIFLLPIIKNSYDKKPEFYRYFYQ